MNNISENDILLDIGKNIKSYRIAKLLSQVDLAHICEMEKSSISRLESGKSNFTIRTLCTLAGALNVQISDITKRRF